MLFFFVFFSSFSNHLLFVLCFVFVYQLFAIYILLFSNFKTVYDIFLPDVNALCTLFILMHEMEHQFGKSDSGCTLFVYLIDFEEIHQKMRWKRVGYF